MSAETTKQPLILEEGELADRVAYFRACLYRYGDLLAELVASDRPLCTADKLRASAASQGFRETFGPVYGLVVPESVRLIYVPAAEGVAVWESDSSKDAVWGVETDQILPVGQPLEYRGVSTYPDMAVVPGESKLSGRLGFPNSLIKLGEFGYRASIEDLAIDLATGDANATTGLRLEGTAEDAEPESRN